MATAPTEDLSEIAQEETPIEVGADDGADADSTFEDGAGSDTTSLASSVGKYRYENGRRYHGYKDGSYVIPNDEKQLSVQDLGHHMILLLTGNKLHTAPIIDKPQRILDIGTGTGIWAIDIADQYPSAEVIGTDLAPTQPAFVPPNLKFEIDDASAEWTFTPKSVDLSSIYRQAYKTLKPGGWIEHQDSGPDCHSDDGTQPPDHPFTKWGNLVEEAGEKLGKTFMIAYHTEELIKKAGFINVVSKKYKLPIGTWPADKRMKELGMWFRAYFEDGMEGYAMALLTRVLNWDYVEAQVFFGQLRAAFKDKRVHSYGTFIITYGQKPFEAKSEPPAKKPESPEPAEPASVPAKSAS